jgi:hypothetical protein
MHLILELPMKVVSLVFLVASVAGLVNSYTWVGLVFGGVLREVLTPGTWT